MIAALGFLASTPREPGCWLEVKTVCRSGEARIDCEGGLIPPTQKNVKIVKSLAGELKERARIVYCQAMGEVSRVVGLNLGYSSDYR